MHTMHTRHTKQGMSCCMFYEYCTTWKQLGREPKYIVLHTSLKNLAGSHGEARLDKSQTESQTVASV